jgi:hypothetical protein
MHIVPAVPIGVQAPLDTFRFETRLQRHSAMPGRGDFLVALVLVVAVLLAAIGQVLDLPSEVLAQLGMLVLGLILVIGIAAVGLSGQDILPTAPPTTVVVAPSLTPRHTHTTSKPRIDAVCDAATQA